MLTEFLFKIEIINDAEKSISIHLEGNNMGLLSTRFPFEEGVGKVVGKNIKGVPILSICPVLSPSMTKYEKETMPNNLAWVL